MLPVTCHDNGDSRPRCGDYDQVCGEAAKCDDDLICGFTKWVLF